ncbi:hypothetical protein GGX14DRAFT_673404 [Mycena pura]|uniref:Uncharacterized protein n=1 Tax=Mycena pura TaxID=153505 RepID=A0AAD6V059_9AGAR|nr:hypothetical protein GGX14DRAFT_673404 [Mycena pura]
MTETCTAVPKSSRRPPVQFQGELRCSFRANCAAVSGRTALQFPGELRCSFRVNCAAVSKRTALQFPGELRCSVQANCAAVIPVQNITGAQFLGVLQGSKSASRSGWRHSVGSLCVQLRDASFPSSFCSLSPRSAFNEAIVVLAATVGLMSIHDPPNFHLQFFPMPSSVSPRSAYPTRRWTTASRRLHLGGQDLLSTHGRSPPASLASAKTRGRLSSDIRSASIDRASDARVRSRPVRPLWLFLFPAPLPGTLDIALAATAQAAPSRITRLRGIGWRSQARQGRM